MNLKDEYYNQVDLQKLFQQLDTRITTLNDRTKVHTIQIKRLEKEIKELRNKEVTQ